MWRVSRGKELLVERWKEHSFVTLGLNWGRIRVAEINTLQNESSAGSENKGQNGSCTGLTLRQQCCKYRPLYHFATLVNFQKCCVRFPQYKERTQFEMQVQVRVWFPCRCKMFFRKSSLMTPQNYWLKPFFPLQNDTPFSFSTNQKVSFWGKWQTVVTFSLNRCSMCTPSPRNFWRF